jgi:Domain of unknown function (DUF3387)
MGGTGDPPVVSRDPRETPIPNSEFELLNSRFIYRNCVITRDPFSKEHKEHKERSFNGAGPERAGKADEPTLKNIARELVSHVPKSVTIDWTLRESAQAQIRVLVRRILRKYGYPPDKQEKATQTVLEQAKLLCAEWAE